MRNSQLNALYCNAPAQRPHDRSIPSHTVEFVVHFSRAQVPLALAPEPKKCYAVVYRCIAPARRGRAPHDSHPLSSLASHGSALQPLALAARHQTYPLGPSRPSTPPRAHGVPPKTVLSQRSHTTSPIPVAPARASNHHLHWAALSCIARRAARRRPTSNDDGRAPAAPRAAWLFRPQVLDRHASGTSASPAPAAQPRLTPPYRTGPRAKTSKTGKSTLGCPRRAASPRRRTSRRFAGSRGRLWPSTGRAY